MSAARKPTSRRSSASESSKKSAAKRAAKRKSTTATAKKASARKNATKKSATKKAAKKSAVKTTAARKGSTTKSQSKKKTSVKAAGARAPRGARRSAASKSAARKPSGRSGSRPRVPKLDRRALDKIRRDLEEERAGYMAQMTELEEQTFQGTQSELTGEVGIDEDFADAGSATFDREQALSIHNNIRDLIDQVDRALARIDDGTYGACERCGRPIDPARLKALPRTLLCTDCKRREERAR